MSLYDAIVIKNAKSKNIDARYLITNEDGTFTPTPLLIYSTARDAMSYFKQLIFTLDNTCQYHSESLKEVKDTWSEKMHEAQWRLKYGNLTKEASKKWHEYKSSHPEEFETHYKRIALGGEDEVRFFTGYSPNIKLNLTEAIKAYNAAREIYERFEAPDKNNVTGGSEYNSLPFEDPLYSKKEFAEKHRQIRINISKELGIPVDDFEVHTITKMVPRINNKKCDVVGVDDTAISTFSKGLIKHLTTSNAAKYRKTSQESITTIDKCFANNFNNNVKTIKKSDAVITIDIITENMFSFMVITSNIYSSMSYSKRISTKTDLRKAIELSINAFKNDTSFKSCVIDLKAILKTL